MPAGLRISIEKYYAQAAEYWVNVYHADGTDMVAAQAVAEDLVAAERGLYDHLTFITKYRIDDMTPNTDVGLTVVKNVAGTSGTSSVNLPLWVVARVDFSTIGGGRPSRKYLRACIPEDEVTFMTLAPVLITKLSAYGVGCIDSGFVDIDGQGINTFAVWPAPAMRQLRRGSKKSNVP